MAFFDGYSNSDIMEYMNEAFDLLTLQEANIVKMDKKTMKKKMLRRATLAAAKAANDPLYHKYLKHTKLRKQYRIQIQEKYQGKAKIVVKQWIAANAEKNK